MNPEEIEQVELELFLDVLNRRYGYDFRNYSRASVRRRARDILAKSGQKYLSDLIPLLLHDEQFATKTIYEFSITVTEMFRDPTFFRAVRQTIAPYLKTYPFIKIWVAGCSTGEEVYSLAVLLHEEGLYDRVKIYATDFNDEALRKAAEGIYALKDIQIYAANYQKAGGTRVFSDYFLEKYNYAIIDQALKSNIFFARHNLVSDGAFHEVQAIFCRNVFIYFERGLQNRVANLFLESLTHGGFLCLGSKESLEFSPVIDQFKVTNAGERIYQKKV